MEVKEWSYEEYPSFDKPVDRVCSGVGVDEAEYQCKAWSACKVVRKGICDCGC